MKPLGFFFALFCCGALAPGLGIAGPAEQDSREAAPASHSPSSTEDPSQQAQTTRNQGQEQLPHDRRLERSAGPYKNSEAGPGHVKPRPHPSHNEPKAAAGKGKPLAGKRNEGDPPRSASKDATVVPQPALNSSAGAAREGLKRPTVERPPSPALPPSRGQLDGLPVNPAQRRNLAPAVIGGSSIATASKNTAVINGTGLKHKP